MWTKEARIQHAPREERYPSDVTDAEWAIIAPMIPPPRQGGRHRETDMREVMNAVRRSGLPRGPPPRAPSQAACGGCGRARRSASIPKNNDRRWSAAENLSATAAIGIPYAIHSAWL